VRITSKGQVTIPQEIREQLGLLPNTEVEFEVDRDAVRVKKATGRDARRARGRGWALIEHMRGRATTGLTTDQIMRLTRG
jgi:AbrB family looped-hinge helix DNA binding protein